MAQSFTTQRKRIPQTQNAYRLAFHIGHSHIARLAENEYVVLYNLKTILCRDNFHGNVVARNCYRQRA